MITWHLSSSSKGYQIIRWWWNDNQMSFNLGWPHFYPYYKSKPKILLSQLIKLLFLLWCVPTGVAEITWTWRWRWCAPTMNWFDDYDHIYHLTNHCNSNDDDHIQYIGPIIASHSLRLILFSPVSDSWLRRSITWSWWWSW